MKGFKYNGEGRELEALFQVCKRKKEKKKNTTDKVALSILVHHMDRN